MNFTLIYYINLLSSKYRCAGVAYIGTRFVKHYLHGFDMRYFQKLLNVINDSDGGGGVVCGATVTREADMQTVVWFSKAQIDMAAVLVCFCIENAKYY